MTKQEIQIGSIEITKCKEGYWITNEDEGMMFKEEKIEELLKQLLYEYF